MCAASSGRGEWLLPELDADIGKSRIARGTTRFRRAGFPGAYTRLSHARVSVTIGHTAEVALVAFVAALNGDSGCLLLAALNDVLAEIGVLCLQLSWTRSIASYTCLFSLALSISEVSSAR